MSSLSQEPDSADGAGAQYHRDGLLVCAIRFATLAYDPGFSADLEMAIPKRRSPRRHISSWWNDASYCDAQWSSHPVIESRVLAGEDNNAIRGGSTASI